MYCKVAAVLFCIYLRTVPYTNKGAKKCGRRKITTLKNWKCKNKERKNMRKAERAICMARYAPGPDRCAPGPALIIKMRFHRVFAHQIFDETSVQKNETLFPLVVLNTIAV